MKKLIVELLLIMTAVVFAGCSGTVSPVPTPTPTTAQASEAPAAASGKIIKPLPSYLDMNNMKDCSFSAGFEAKDVYLNDDGALVVHMTVYDYELFDLVEMSELAVGDTLVINGAEVIVDTLERDSAGGITINGGLDKGGHYIATDENGVYYELGMDDAYSYYALGEVTLPVDQDFVLTDGSDLEKPERTLYAGDFLMEMENSSESFSPINTTVTVVGGKIVDMVRVYAP